MEWWWCVGEGGGKGGRRERGRGKGCHPCQLLPRDMRCPLAGPGSQRRATQTLRIPACSLLPASQLLLAGAIVQDYVTSLLLAARAREGVRPHLIRGKYQKRKMTHAQAVRIMKHSATDPLISASTPPKKRIQAEGPLPTLPAGSMIMMHASLGHARSFGSSPLLTLCQQS